MDFFYTLDKVSLVGREGNRTVCIYIYYLSPKHFIFSESNTLSIKKFLVYSPFYLFVWLLSYLEFHVFENCIITSNFNSKLMV